MGRWRKMDGLVDVGRGEGWVGGGRGGSVEENGWVDGGGLVEENGWLGGRRGMSRGRKREVPKLLSLAAGLAGIMAGPWVNG